MSKEFGDSEEMAFESNSSNDDMMDIEPESNERNLLSLPKEVLGHVLSFLDDKNLLNVTHVSRTFGPVVENVFSSKYSKKTYNLHTNDIGYHNVILTKYGSKFRDLDVYISDRRNDEWILNVAKENCPNLNRISLHKCRGLEYLENCNKLKSIRLDEIDDINEQNFSQLLDNNPNIQDIECRRSNFNFFDTLNNRSNLKSLRISEWSDITMNSTKITLDSLEVLSLFLRNQHDYANIIRRLDCKSLKSLTVGNNIADDNLLQCTSAFSTLTAFSCYFPLTMNQMRQLANDLPNLKKVAMKLEESNELNSLVDSEEDLFNVISIFPEIDEIKFYFINFTFFYKFRTLFENYDFHERLSRRFPKVEVKILDKNNMISISRDIIVFMKTNSVEVHLMNVINVEKIRKILYYGSFYKKFINNCPEPLDLSTLCSQRDNTIHLDIRSVGEITVNTIASSLIDFFPALTSLEIHLTNHTPTKLLRNLHRHFCERIRKLSLNMKMISIDQDEEYRSEINEHLTKFFNPKFDSVTTYKDNDCNFSSVEPFNQIGDHLGLDISYLPLGFGV